MGWAARANHSAETSKAFGHRKPAPPKKTGWVNPPRVQLIRRGQVNRAAVAAMLQAFSAKVMRQPDTPELPANAGEILAGGSSNGE